MVASSKAQRILLIVLVALLTAIGVVLVTHPSSSSSATTAASTEFDGPTMPPGLRAANFSLTDQYGHRVTLSHYRGQVVVLTFIHSLCKDTCPFMVEQIKGALNDLPGSGRGVPTIGVSVAPKAAGVVRDVHESWPVPFVADVAFVLEQAKHPAHR